MTPTDNFIHRAVVQRIDQIARDTFEVTLRLTSGGLAFHPGQYIWLELLQPKYPDPRGNRRGFSLTSSSVMLGVIQVVNRGTTSKYKRSLLAAVGQEVQVIGPHGTSYRLPAVVTSPIVVLAGGTGITPFLSYLRSNLPAPESTAPLTIVRYEDSDDRFAYLAELEQLQRRSPHLRIIHQTARPTWSQLAELRTDGSPPTWYVAGPQGFIDAVDALFQAHGVRDEDIRYEQFYPQRQRSSVLAKLYETNAGQTAAEFVTSGIDGGTERIDNVTAHSLSILFFLGGLLSFAIGVWWFVAGHHYQTNVLFAAAIWSAWLAWRRPRWRPVILYFILAISGLTLLVTMVTGGNQRSAIVWAGIFPAAAMLLRPRIGLRLSLFYLAAIAVVVLASLSEGTTLAYLTTMYVNVLGAVSLLTLILATFFRNQRRIERQLINAWQQEQVFHRAMEKTSNHVVVTDRNGFIVYANTAAQRITGFTYEEMRGQTPRLWGGMMPTEFYHQLWQTILSGETMNSEITNRRKNGELYTAIAHVAPIFDRQGAIIGFIGTEEDITLRKRDEVHLQELKRRIELATRSAQIGVWDWDVVRNILIWDDRMYRLYGLQPSAFRGVHQNWQASIHPEDRAAADQAIQDALDGRREFNTQFRIIWPDASIHVIRAHAIVERHTDGHPLKMIGVNWDVTKETQVDRAKTEFVSLASHQLRTPLTAIKWYSEMLLDDDVGKLTKRQREYVQEVIVGNDRMIRLVNALLNTSRIELGTLAIESQPTSLTDLTAETLKECQIRYRGKHQTVSTDFDSSLPTINLDPKLFRIVIQNLLNNAMKYTPDGGQIHVNLQRQGDFATFVVVDTGYGIPASAQRHIFSKMFRADNIRDKVTEGTGLGLYIAKAVVEAGGGTLTFTSTEGRGTTFTATVPLKGMPTRTGTKGLELMN